MTKRLQEIFSQIEKTGVFADVGCDHGYIAKAMIKSGKCKTVIVSDISLPCLKKAEKLLSEEINNGTCQSVLSNGLKNLPVCDAVLIAGMGGEEIISIINEAPFYPETFYLQPMKNTDKVRRFVVNKGYKIIKDYCFADGKRFYDFIHIIKGKDVLSDEEAEFGRTNLVNRPKAFTDKISCEITAIDKLIKSGKLSGNALNQMQSKRELLKKYV